jgi:hypothetical protein
VSGTRDAKCGCVRFALVDLMSLCDKTDARGKMGAEALATSLTVTAWKKELAVVLICLICATVKSPHSQMWSMI